ncbi:phospholipase/Carboxylesterase superfamily protein [Clohesyomyces aquaticus]|uniref:Phospholipase/Carboxylesterase superfamily protein n=1 Tax=Clohesyomyces aquaticus TaxID=1231657 RepID=A0A1Y1YF52_9PLEO|nr:phospholipase/Carboxylesterase superfamily protein [Clohesyomyces aquaticus]
MPGRLPEKNDFASSISLSITPPPSSQPPTNVLILLHGLGDTHAPFTKLGQQLSLPETVSISVQAPNPLPLDLGGFHWGDDLVFDQNTGEMDVDTGFKTSTVMVLDSIIRQGLIGKCGYKAREIVLFGFAQGGMVALQAAAELGGDELEGVVSIGGVLSLTLPLKALERKSRTPVLLCKGSRSSAVSDSAISKLKDAFEFVEIKEWRKVGDGMPSNREEMLPIMQFFARRLQSTRGVPAGSIELT